MSRIWLLALALVFATIAVVPAHADALGDLEKLYNAVPADERPFPSFDDLRTLIQQCGNVNSSADCVDSVNNLEIAQGSGLDLVVMWIRVFYDLNPPDYWALAQDAAEAIACTAAQIIFDVDVCGVIKALVEAAEAAIHDVQAALQFIGDLLGAGGAALKAAYCDIGGGIFGGCDDDSPQPPPEALAFANYYFPLIPDGMWNREKNPATWNKYQSDVIAGCKGGYSSLACEKAYPAFEQAVLTAWDADIVQTRLPLTTQRRQEQWTAGTVAQHQADVQGVSALLTSEPWEFNFTPVTLLKFECKTDMLNHGSQTVQDWINAGRYQQAKIPPPPSPPWGTADSLCTAFDDASLKTMRLAAFNEGLAQISQTGICSQVSAQPLTYDCQETSYKNSPQTTDCSTVLSLSDQLPSGSACFPPKHWDCPKSANAFQPNKKNKRQQVPASTKYESITLPAHQQPPAGCTAGDVSPGKPKVTLNCGGKMVEAEFGTQLPGCKVEQGIGVDPSAQCKQLTAELVQAINNKDAVAEQKIIADIQKAGCDQAGQNGQGQGMSGPPH